MALKRNEMKCPSCGANLEFKSSYDNIFCMYCGVPIVITNENEKTKDREFQLHIIKIRATILIVVLTGITFSIGLFSDYNQNIALLSLIGFIILAVMWLK